MGTNKHILELKTIHYTWADKDQPSDNSDGFSWLATTNYNAVRYEMIRLSETEFSDILTHFPTGDSVLVQVPECGIYQTRLVFKKERVPTVHISEFDFDTLKGMINTLLTKKQLVDGDSTLQ